MWKRLSRKYLSIYGHTSQKRKLFCPKIEDSQTFILTYLADEDVKNPIRSLPSFKELQEFIKFNDIENPLNIE